jgi:hypothetical protein
MSTPTTNPVAWHDASSYAAAVRLHLDDLAPEVVEELTGGLEADLLDQATESTEPLGRRLGDPAGYAAELRAAAGVRPRTVPPRGPGVIDRFRAEVEENLQGLRQQTWWPQAASIAEQMRPVWWVVRAWVAFQLVDQLSSTSGGAVPSSFGEWLLLLVLVAGSVALGRGLWSRWSGRRALLLGGNALALLFLLPALVWSDETATTSWSEPAYADVTGSGLVLDGETVTNVFPYGPDGEPLQGVTLLDQDGDPLAVGTDTLPGDDEVDPSGRVRVQVPNWTADGDMVWHAFPMGTASVDADELYSEWYSGADRPGSMLRPPYRSYQEASPPRLRVPAVLVDPSRALRPDGAVPTPSATPSATASLPPSGAATTPQATTPGPPVTPPATTPAPAVTPTP